MNDSSMNPDDPSVEGHAATALAQSREALSVALDDELPAHQLQFLVRALGHDASLQQRWNRYEIMRDVLRGSLPVSAASTGFSARVHAAIATDVPVSISISRPRRWLRWSAGGAIAASVAAATLMIGQPTADSERAIATQAADNDGGSATNAATASWAAPSPVPPWLSGNPAGLLSQRASVTLGAPLRDAGVIPTDAANMAPPYRYRTLDNADGSYLLLNPAQASSVAHLASPRAAAGAR